MGNIDPHHVLIESGTIVESPITTEIGTFQYFVNVVEDDGCKIGLWSGASYSDALAQADEIAEEWGFLPVIDIAGRRRYLQ